MFKPKKAYDDPENFAQFKALIEPDTLVKAYTVFDDDDYRRCVPCKSNVVGLPPWL